jgi:hypothetical protein
LVTAGVALCALLGSVGPASGSEGAGGDGIVYRTLFQDPGAVPGTDFSLEDHAIALINATPAGARITFAFRDYNRATITDALLAAHARGVVLDGVIDGGERIRTQVQRLLAGLGPERLVLCGSPTFVFNSCIASSLVPSLQHNKFMTFSELDDGRHDVVLQTSENFFAPSQFSYYNDMVEIDGDVALHAAYAQYVADMKAQVRSDDHYLIVSGDDGRNTMFPSPRRQGSRDTDDTIVDRMNEIDCSRGGSIRAANMAFRTERAVIMRKLVELHRAGCDVDVVFSNADGDIIAGLVSAGIPVHPFFLRAVAPLPQVMVHDKFWLVDAKSTLTGRRTKVVFAGSSNWRADQQQSDDLLLRIIDDGVFEAYSRYWELIASRAASDQSRPTTDAVVPSSALTATPAANEAGWNRSDVTVRVAASDGHNVQASGLARLHVDMSGAQEGSWDFAGEQDGYNVQELPISSEGPTTITYLAEDAKGNRETAHTGVVSVDKTAPEIGGLPEHCVLWPPDHRLVHVADVTATDALSGLDDLRVRVRSVPRGDASDIVIAGGSVDLRAEKATRGRRRVYRIRARATDRAGNVARAGASCTVPRSRGAGER